MTAHFGAFHDGSIELHLDCSSGAADRVGGQVEGVTGPGTYVMTWGEWTSGGQLRIRPFAGQCTVAIDTLEAQMAPDGTMQRRVGGSFTCAQADAAVIASFEAVASPELPR